MTLPIHLGIFAIGQQFTSISEYFNTYTCAISVNRPIINGNLNQWVTTINVRRPTISAETFSGSSLASNINIRPIGIIASIIQGQLTQVHIITPAVHISGRIVQSEIFNSSIIVNKPRVCGSILSQQIYTFNTRIKKPTLVISVINESADFTAYATYVFNTLTTATSTYTNFNFNSYFKLDNKYYGVSDSGIYELTGNNDVASNIQSEVYLPISSFDKQGLKACSDAIIFGRLSGDIEVVVVLDEQEEREGLFVTSDERQGLHRIRVKVPKGLKGSTWQYKLRNVDGSDFSINNFEVFLKELKRIR